jgi:hypothetical protein
MEWFYILLIGFCLRGEGFRFLVRLFYVEDGRGDEDVGLGRDDG